MDLYNYHATSAHEDSTHTIISEFMLLKRLHGCHVVILTVSQPPLIGTVTCCACESDILLPGSQNVYMYTAHSDRIMPDTIVIVSLSVAITVITADLYTQL